MIMKLIKQSEYMVQLYDSIILDTGFMEQWLWLAVSMGSVVESIGFQKFIPCTHSHTLTC